MSDQPRWPAGTPVAPSGKGPGGGRFRDDGPDWADSLASNMVPGNRFTQGLMSHEQVAKYIGRTDYQVFGSAGGGMGEVEFREYADGRLIAAKTIYSENPDEIDAEVETSLVARALGIPVPAVVRDPDRPDTILMEYIEPQTRGNMEYLVEQQRDSDTGRLLGLLDVIVGNRDRHNGNAILTWDGLVGIDHGLAFERPWFYQPRHRVAMGLTDSGLAPPTLAASSSFGRRLFRRVNGEEVFGSRLQEDDELVQWVFSREAIREARRRIESLRSQLRPHSYAGIAEVLDVLESMSVGGQMLD